MTPIIGQRFGDDSPTNYAQSNYNNPNSYYPYTQTQIPAGSYVNYAHVQDAQGNVQHYEDKGTISNNGQYVPDSSVNNGQWKPDSTTSTYTTTTSKY